MDMYTRIYLLFVIVYLFLMGDNLWGELFVRVFTSFLLIVAFSVLVSGENMTCLPY
jgi:hypothetical protein